MIKSKFCFLLFVNLFLIALILDLGCSDKQESAAGKEITELVNSTVPPNAVLIGKAETGGQQESISGFWEFESEWNWKQYSEWVTKNFTGRYELIAAEEGSLTFRRSLTGDTYSFQIQNSSMNRLHVRVHFIARPY
jgi:hypothetical protein